MVQLLQVRDLHKAYDGRSLLEGAALTIEDRHKIGLIGRNGCGKSTLLGIIRGEIEADDGDVTTHGDCRLAHLPQHDPFTPDETVAAFLTRFSGQPDWRCAELAARFGFSPQGLERALGQCSGGWRTRAKLVAILLQEPNLLLLDEPTNFLDLRTQVFLTAFLADWRGAALIVSHDRGFLTATCTHTAELARGRITCEAGDVAGFLARSAERRGLQARANANVLAKRRQLERFVATNRANANTASQARSKAKQLDKLQTTEIDGDERRAVIRVPAVAARAGTACAIDDLAVGYDGVAVAAGLTLDLPRGERVAVVGDNGQGKTTLLRSLAGDLAPVAGRVRWTHGADLGLYAQHVYAALAGAGTVEAALQARAAAGITSQQVLDTAGSFLFSGDDVRKPLDVLSGGERARVCLAGLLLGGHTVLVLDEPTNHLDVETIASLAEALTRYRGTVLLASHDRDFVATVATTVIEVQDGVIRAYPGGHDAYLARLQRDASDQASPPPGAVRRPLTSRDRRRLDKAVAAAERKVEQIQGRLEAVDAALLAAHANLAEVQRLDRERGNLARQLAEAEERWLAAAAEREAANPETTDTRDP